ncbi:transposase [Neomoorella mulderi]|uniref:Transposase InsH N-terminal domain-containing protein n=1 Tax=Moorella mulderi DSM 14980 TaxID=1122241 RepID=A0A151AUY5_9FIRM|nr:transposase [Moorella mulderi]KYH31484.1 hypothetical protein MOMUL_22230 [Moorella mulderi DSM 14980]
MMGKSDKQKQLSFTNLENLSQWEGLPIVPEDSIPCRPGLPAFLWKVMVLQFLDNVSDREAEARARYDLRWKKTLGVGLAEAGFDYFYNLSFPFPQEEPRSTLP